MGEIADDHIDRMLQEGHFPFRRPRTKWIVTFSQCGASGLKWRETDAGWRLFENERVEHNRLKPHECNPPSEDDFDVIEDQ